MFLFSFLRFTRFNRRLPQRTADRLDLPRRQRRVDSCRTCSRSRQVNSATFSPAGLSFDRRRRCVRLAATVLLNLLEKLALSGAERCQRIPLASPGARESYAEWRVEGLLYRGSQSARSLACFPPSTCLSPASKQGPCWGNRPEGAMHAVSCAARKVVQLCLAGYLSSAMAVRGSRQQRRNGRWLLVLPLAVPVPLVHSNARPPMRETAPSQTTPCASHEPRATLH